MYSSKCIVLCTNVEAYLLYVIVDRGNDGVAVEANEFLENWGDVLFGRVALHHRSARTLQSVKFNQSTSLNQSNA